jgi:hypothetical protein
MRTFFARSWFGNIWKCLLLLSKWQFWPKSTGTPRPSWYVHMRKWRASTDFGQIVPNMQSRFHPHTYYAYVLDMVPLQFSRYILVVLTLIPLQSNWILLFDCAGICIVHEILFRAWFLSLLIWANNAGSCIWCSETALIAGSAGWLHFCVGIKVGVLRDSHYLFLTPYRIFEWFFCAKKK